MIDLVNDGSSFALLAAGGAGKSETFSAMSGQDPGAAYVDVSILRRNDIERELVDLQGREQAVYLDGLDQTAVHDPAVLRWLASRLTAPSFAAISWRLACRSAAWEKSLADALRRSRGRFDEWKLLPLDRGTAQLAVAAHFGDDSEAAAFVEALARARLGTLSACVGQLAATALYWRKKGHLPDGGVDAMLFEITELVREGNSAWPSAQSVESRLAITKRLGAMTVFSGEQVVLVRPGMTDGLSVGDLPDDPEPSNPTGRVEVDHYREVLGTAVFDPGPEGTVTFRHQRYAEFLAAAYLVDRHATPSQIADVTGTRTTRALPAAMIPVVAWLAALTPDAVHDIVRDNAHVLAAAAAAVELPDGRARSVIVGGLLDAAGRHEADPDWSIAARTLVHHDLEAQLLDRLAAGPLTPEQIWWAARLAAAGGCGALAADLAAVAHDTSWYDYVRRAAVSAVGAIGDHAVTATLTDLLHPGADEDTDNEILAAAIDVLYPGLLSTAELLGTLRPQPSDGLLGGWARTLRELADRVPRDDLRAVLAWLGSPDNEIDFDARTYFAGLFEAVLSRAWQHHDDPAIVGALATALVSCVEHKHERLPMNPTYPWTTVLRERRQAFTLDVLRAAASSRNVRFVVHELRLLRNDDAHWLLDRIEDSSPDVAQAAAECLPLLLHDPTAQLADRILGLPETHPAAAAVAFFRDPVEVDDPRFAHEREHNARRHRIERERTTRLGERQAELGVLLPLLDDAPLRWFEAVCLLTDPASPDRSDDIFGLDLTRRPGWAQLDPEQQRHMLHAGLRYLDAHQPRVEEWWGETQGVTLGLAGPDWFGVQLMTTLVRHDGALLTEISSGTWERWATAIIATWTRARSPDDDVRPRLLAYFPPTARPALLAAALDYLDVVDTKDVPTYPHGIYQQLLVELWPDLVERLQENRYGPGLSKDLLHLIITESTSTDARELVLRLCDHAEKPVSALALERLAALDARAAIDRLDGAPRTTEHLVPALHYLNVADLDDTRLARVATLLLDIFPYANDPPNFYSFVWAPRREMRELTGALLQQLTDRGRIEILERLLHRRPDLDQQAVGGYLVRARRRRAELDHHPTTPRELLDLLRRGDGRLVRDAPDLLDVAVAQLDRLQHDLRHGGAWPEIWNNPQSPDAVPRTEDDISDWVRRRLNDRMNNGTVVDREVQVDRPRGRGIGTRIDLTLTAASTPTAPLARVLAEAKRVDNAELLTALRKQLVERYLVPMGLTHGLYLVYWIRPEQKPSGWSRSAAADMSVLRAELARQAEEVARTHGIEVTVYVLDVSRPVPSTP